MTKYTKIGLGLAAFILVFGLMAQAQTAPLSASISAPVSGSSYNVGQTVALTGTATGGTGTYPSFRWAFSDGTASIVGANQSVSFATAGSKTITLTVTDSNGDRAVVSRTITVGASNRPVISNVAVGDITQTGATITWTTNIPASSRVIYDTTSHPSLDGQTAPNFGYAASTPETDVETKVTSHSVTISGLNPNTRYYFRVISQG